MVAFPTIKIMKYIYNLISKNILIDIPFNIDITKESKNFMKLFKNETFDFCITFKEIQNLSLLDNFGQFECSQYYTKDYIYYCNKPYGNPYAYRKINDYQVYYKKGKETFLNNSRNIIDIIGLDSFLLENNGFILHSSFINWQGKGILFTAPSGTGKSTQADLWCKYENAEIINGDRAAVVYQNEWKAYGMPIAGSSLIYENKSAKLSTIIVLKQSNTNTIRKLTSTESLKYLIPEISARRWDKEYMNALIDLVIQLLRDIPIYILECKIDKEAVECVKRIVGDVNE